MCMLVCCVQGEVEQAMAMYRELHHWEDAIAIASSRVREGGREEVLTVNCFLVLLAFLFVTESS